VITLAKRGVLFSFMVFLIMLLLVSLHYNLFEQNSRVNQDVMMMMGADSIYNPSQDIREDILTMLYINFTVIGDDNKIQQNVTLTGNESRCASTDDLEFYKNFTDDILTPLLYPTVELGVQRIIDDSERKVCSYDIHPINITYEWNFESFYVNLTGAIDCVLGMEVIMYVDNATVQTMTGSGVNKKDGDFYYYFEVIGTDGGDSSNSTYDRTKKYTINVQLKETGPPPNPDAGKVVSNFDFTDDDLRIEFEDIKWDVIESIKTTINTKIDRDCLDGQEIKVLYADTYLNVTSVFESSRNSELTADLSW
jgi:hypothetical protein